MANLWYFLDFFESFIWSYLALPAIVLVGFYLTLYFKLPQLSQFKKIIKAFYVSVGFGKAEGNKSESRGVSPLHAFFTSIGGCIGIANLVAVCSAIKVGGPGSLFWIWVAAFLGMVVKYCEVYLGVSYRVPNKRGGFDGGPMYYLQKVFKGPFIPLLVAFLLMVYGTEIYMFTVVTDSIVTNWGLNHSLVITLLLIVILLASVGGVSRVGKVSSLVIPLFLLLYVGMCTWVFVQNSHLILPSLGLIFKSAFDPSAVVSGGVAASFLRTMQEGVTRGCYSGDIGVGYAGIVHAESSAKDPKHQALLSIFGVFLDSFVVCTATALLVVVTGVWNQPIEASMMVQAALSPYFSLMKFFMPFFIFLLGYSTMIAFLTVGLKSAQFVSPKKGRKIYLICSSIAFITFSFVSQSSALAVMGIVGAFLLLINVYGIFMLRKKIKI